MYSQGICIFKTNRIQIFLLILRKISPLSLERSSNDFGDDHKQENKSFHVRLVNILRPLKKKKKIFIGATTILNHQVGRLVMSGMFQTGGKLSPPLLHPVRQVFQTHSYYMNSHYSVWTQIRGTSFIHRLTDFECSFACVQSRPFVVDRVEDNTINNIFASS